jgi:hypothetical protein
LHYKSRASTRRSGYTHVTLIDFCNIISIRTVCVTPPVQ